MELLESARRTAGRAVNVVMTAAYWQVGRRIIEYEQGGQDRAQYGTQLLARLAVDLAGRFGRGFSRQNLQQMRQFYLVYPPARICQTASGEFSNGEIAPRAICQTPSGKSDNSRQTSEIQAIFREASEISQTPSAKSLVPQKSQTPSGLLAAEKYATPSRKFSMAELARAFPLPWSH